MYCLIIGCVFVDVIATFPAPLIEFNPLLFATPTPAPTPPAKLLF